MRESIEAWKVLILIAEMFCFGGSVFAGMGKKTGMVLSILTCLFGIVYISVV